MMLSRALLLLFTCFFCRLQDALANIHGGTFLAMAGKNSVVLVSDTRFSSMNKVLLGSHPRSILRVGTRSLVGCFGIDSHARVLMKDVKDVFIDHRDSEVGPENVARVVSDIQYRRRLAIGPIVVGLDGDEKPYLCSMDGLGAQTRTNKFAVQGTATKGMLALCESLYQPNLEAPELAKLAERCFNLAMQRDVLSGSHLRVLTLTKDALYSKMVEKLDA